jgi:hypothetical protein
MIRNTEHVMPQKTLFKTIFAKSLDNCTRDALKMRMELYLMCILFRYILINIVTRGHFW